MMWGSFGLGISMMLIAILLSFQDRGGSLAKATSSASVVRVIIPEVNTVRPETNCAADILLHCKL